MHDPSPTCDGSMPEHASMPVQFGLGVAVGVAVGVDVGVAVGVSVGVAVGVSVGVAVGVAVGVGVIHPAGRLSLRWQSPTGNVPPGWHAVPVVLHELLPIEPAAL